MRKAIALFTFLLMQSAFADSLCFLTEQARAHKHATRTMLKSDDFFEELKLNPDDIKIKRKFKSPEGQAGDRNADQLYEVTVGNSDETYLVKVMTHHESNALEVQKTAIYAQHLLARHGYAPELKGVISGKEDMAKFYQQAGIFNFSGSELAIVMKKIEGGTLVHMEQIADKNMVAKHMFLRNAPKRRIKKELRLAQEIFDSYGLYFEDPQFLYTPDGKINFIDFEDVTFVGDEVYKTKKNNFNKYDHHFQEVLDLDEMFRIDMDADIEDL